MDVSPNGKYVASSCMADTVRIWEADTARELHRLPGHGPLGNRRSVRFTPDSQRLLSWGDDMYVRVWDVRTGKKLQEYEAKPTAAQIEQRAILLGLEFDRGSELGLRAGVFSQDATRLVLALKAMHVFDVASGRDLLKFDYPKTSILWHLAISPDNRYALLVGFGYEYEESPTGGKPVRKTIHRAELRQLSDGKLVGELNREDGGEAAAAFSPDGRHAAITVGKVDPRVVVVKIPDMTEVARIDGFRELLQALEFSNSGKLLAVSNGDTSVVVYDVEKLPGN
jgi:WD40 repeat protein